MRIFISHASEDHEKARSLFDLLKKDGFDPWLDACSFDPGECEPQIQPAIRSSDVFVFLISRASRHRDGLYNSEIKFALKMEREDRGCGPVIIPLRLDDSEKPTNLEPYRTYDLYSTAASVTSGRIDGLGYDEFKKAISGLPQRTSRYIFSLHGIRTRGVWQGEITPVLARAGMIPVPEDYGYFTASQLLWPPSRKKKVKQFVKAYDDFKKANEGIIPSILAHSFGTYIAGCAIRTHPYIKFDRIIFCGAILNRDFPWGEITEKGQVKAVLNQYGGKDFWAWVAGWTISDGGEAGRYGFSLPASSLKQQHFQDFGHSDYFRQLNYTDNWLPFLTDNPIGHAPVQHIAQKNLRFQISLVVTLTLTVLLFCFLTLKRTGRGDTRGREGVDPPPTEKTDYVKECKFTQSLDKGNNTKGFGVGKTLQYDCAIDPSQKLLTASTEMDMVFVGGGEGEIEVELKPLVDGKEQPCPHSEIRGRCWNGVQLEQGKPSRDIGLKSSALNRGGTSSWYLTITKCMLKDGTSGVCKTSEKFEVVIR